MFRLVQTVPDCLGELVQLSGSRSTVPGGGRGNLLSGELRHNRQAWAALDCRMRSGSRTRIKRRAEAEMMRPGQAGATRSRRWVATRLARLPVHRAARLAAVAHWGQVVRPVAVAGLLRDWLTASVGLKDLGLRHLEGVSQSEQIFQLQAEGLPAAVRCGRWATRRC